MYTRCNYIRMWVHACELCPYVMYKVREGVSEQWGISEHLAENVLFLKRTLDFVSENKCIHIYYFRTLQQRLGLNVPLRNGKLSAKCSETAHHSESSSIWLLGLVDSSGESETAYTTQWPQWSNLSKGHIWPNEYAELICVTNIYNMYGSRQDRLLTNKDTWPAWLDMYVPWI